FQARMIGDFLDNYRHLKPEEAKSSADGRPLENFNRGQYLFGRDCLACHTIGHGDKIGPDLLGVTRNRERQWLIRIVQRPDQLLRDKDLLAITLLKKYKNLPMPNLGVSDAEVEYLLEYIEAQTVAHDKDMGPGNRKPRE